MRAVICEEFGPPHVLRMTEVADPHAGPGQVRIAVHAAGANPVDTQNRADGAWARLEPGCVLGYDVAGVVDQVGAGVTDLKSGDRVMAMLPFPDTAGGYAEFATVDAGLVAAIPPDCSFDEAAAAPLAAGTAHEILRRLELPPASWLLVLGAGGGVGTFLIQLAAASGLRVIAVAGARSHRLLGELGAVSCIDYTNAEVAPAAVKAAGGPVDAIVDLVGETILSECLPAVRPRGQLAAISTPNLDLDPVLDANLTFHGILIDDDGGRTRAVADFLHRGTVRSVISHVFPLEDVAEAHRLLESRHTGGKVVLRVRE